MIVSTTGVKNIAIVGHRGDWGDPEKQDKKIKIENTVPSFNSGWQAGAHALEGDWQLSKDSVLFTHHDDNFGRVFLPPDGDIKKLACSYYWDDIKQAQFNRTGMETELGKKFGRTVNLEAIEELRIPSLDEFPFPGDKSKKLFLELKVPFDKEPTTLEGAAYLDELIKQTVHFLEDHKLTDQVYILCFVSSVLDRVKTLNPQIKTVYNVYQNEIDTKVKSPQDAARKLRELHSAHEFDVIHPPFEQVTEDSIKISQDLGIPIYAWVWNEPPKTEITEAKRLIQAGINGVTTNQLQKVLALCP